MYLQDVQHLVLCYFFFFNDTATTEIYTLSLHDALPIWCGSPEHDLVGTVGGTAIKPGRGRADNGRAGEGGVGAERDRKSTRLNSSHGYISYAVFCLKKKKLRKANRGRI